MGNSQLEISVGVATMQRLGRDGDGSISESEYALCFVNLLGTPLVF